MIRKLKYILVLFIVVSLSACDKYLTLEPQDGIVRQDFWKTKEQVAAAVNGCYASLLNTQLAENLFLWGELRADMLEPFAATSNELNVINVNIQPTNPITNWAPFYQTINNCNTVIEFAPQVLNSDNTFNETALNGYVGEALALRSLMYFYLVRTFKEVPLKLKSTSNDEDNLQIPKSTEAEILDQIIKDLKLAEQYTLTTYKNKDQDKGRITKYAVQTILADVYLWKNDYENCIAYCNKVIQSNQFGLVSGDSNWFGTVFYQGASSESIFELYFNSLKPNPFYAMFAQTNRRFKSAIRVVQEVYTIDYDNLDNKDIRGDGAALKFNDGNIWKYQGVNSSTARAANASSSTGHWFFYRYADILLMKAEALNQVNKGKDALDLVIEIRERGNALKATEQVFTDFTDKEGIARYILDERAREFAFEGKRWFDLLRNAKRNNYEMLSLILDVVVTTASPEHQQSALTKLRDVNSHYLPINLNELQTNKQLLQNPFYTSK